VPSYIVNFSLFLVCLLVESGIFVLGMTDQCYEHSGRERTRIYGWAWQIGKYMHTPYRRAASNSMGFSQSASDPFIKAERCPILLHSNPDGLDTTTHCRGTTVAACLLSLTAQQQHDPSMRRYEDQRDPRTFVPMDWWAWPILLLPASTDQWSPPPCSSTQLWGGRAEKAMGSDAMMLDRLTFRPHQSSPISQRQEPGG
jgi:hypothetical protein